MATVKRAQGLVRDSKEPAEVALETSAGRMTEIITSENNGNRQYARHGGAGTITRLRGG